MQGERGNAKRKKHLDMVDIVLAAKVIFKFTSCLTFSTPLRVVNVYKYHPTSGLMQILHFDWLRY